MCVLWCSTCALRRSPSLSGQWTHSPFSILIQTWWICVRCNGRRCVDRDGRCQGTRNGWSSSIYKRYSLGNRIGEMSTQATPDDESLWQRLLVSMRTGDSRQFMGECRFSYIHDSWGGGVPAEATAKASGGPTMPSHASVGDRGQG